MSAPTVWITGAGGLIGSHLVRAAGELAPAWRVLSPSRGQLDLSDLRAVAVFFAREQPDCLLHCAALSRVAACEADPERAALLNIEVTRHLAQLAADRPFVLLSTDVVFDGRKGGYRESDSVHPLSVYARTKAEAEQIVLQNPRHTVVRPAINTGASPTGDRSFTEQMRLAWMRGETLTCFTDEFRCPLPAVVTARAVWELVGKDRPGLYHLGGAEKLSRFDLASLWAARWPELDCRIKPGSLHSHEGPPRPADTSLDCSKIQALLSFPLPKFSEWLHAHPEAMR
jgi:dTDP-4-dehydrorhamnose reductase